MKSIYVDAGALTAIRVPPEVVDILMAPAGSPGTSPDPETAGKYGPLTTYLAALDADTVSMTFSEIEDILGDSLAPSARRYLPYWYSPQNSLGKAVVAAGFRASRVRTEGETVDFVRRR
jgi:hypothetical protein